MSNTNASHTLNEDGTVVSIDLKTDDFVTKEKFTKLEIKKLGLSENDFDAVRQTAQSININDPQSINLFGQSLGKKTSKCTDELLEIVKSKDIDVAGGQLNKILVLAQDTNAEGLTKKNYSNIPIIGGLISKISKSSRNFSNSLQTTQESFDAIVKEIGENVNGLSDRINMLENMFNSVTEEYRELGVFVASGRLVIEEIDQKIAEMQQDDLSDQMVVQKLSDLNNTRTRLEKRVDDLHLLQQSAMQTLPQIRLIQGNNTMLIDKFHAIKTVTLPAWKNQISLSLSLKEQKNSVALTNAIDDATNELLRRNAELLKQNTIETAKSNQRSVIDVATLEHVQNSLIETVKETMVIQENGKRERLESQKRLTALQEKMQSQIIEGSAAVKRVETRM